MVSIDYDCGGSAPPVLEADSSFPE